MRNHQLGHGIQCVPPEHADSPDWDGQVGCIKMMMIMMVVVIMVRVMTQMVSGQIITTSADVTLNGGLIRELPQNPLNSGLGIILICPEWFGAIYP